MKSRTPRQSITSDTDDDVEWRNTNNTVDRQDIPRERDNASSRQSALDRNGEGASKPVNRNNKIRSNAWDRSNSHNWRTRHTKVHHMKRNLIGHHRLGRTTPS